MLGGELPGGGHMARFEYLGGLGEGRLGDVVSLALDGSNVTIEHGTKEILGPDLWLGMSIRDAWSSRIPLREMITLNVDRVSKHVSAGRVIMNGNLIGLMSKKHDYALAISRRVEGLPSALLLGGKRDELESLRQEILSARVADKISARREV